MRKMMVTEPGENHRSSMAIDALPFSQAGFNIGGSQSHDSFSRSPINPQHP
jgi:hypothetical protein